MTEGEPLSDRARRHYKATTVEVFDPPMCCPTGLCGPTIDSALLDVNEMVLNLQQQGVAVERYSMAQQPQAFLNNTDLLSAGDKVSIPAIRRRLEAAGLKPQS